MINSSCGEELNRPCYGSYSRPSVSELQMRAGIDFYQTDKYLSPLSGIIATISLSGYFFASSFAAQTFAPAEIPQKTPCFLANSIACTFAFSLLTVNTPSKLLSLQISGIKFAPIP